MSRESSHERPAAPAIEVRGLVRRMNGRAILAGVDLAIAGGESVALLGANGAGKSTLLHCMAGRLRPTSGEIRWFARSPARQPDLHRLVGLLAHECGLYPELTVGENLLFAARLQGVPDPHRRVAELLSETKLDALAERPAGQISRGQRQRLALARVLIHDPPLLLLDEPWTSLDATGRDWLDHWLQGLRSGGHAIVFTSHDRHHCHGLADRVLELRGGQIHAARHASAFSATAAREAA